MREQARNVFEAYLQNFSLEEHPVLIRKKEHSYRVAENCAALGMACFLPQEEIDMLYVIGLFHDLGQFFLIDRYGNKNAMDHGEQSVLLLYDCGIFAEITKETKYDTLVKKSIAAHNQFSIPEEYTEKEKMFASILRDADKLDIFYELATKQIVISVTNADVTKEVWDAFQAFMPVERSLVKTSFDHLLKVLSFLYGLEYEFSLFQFEKKAYLETILEQSRHQDDTMDEALLTTEGIMKKYIRKRIGE